MSATPGKALLVTRDDSIWRFFSLLFRDSVLKLSKAADPGSPLSDIKRVNPALVLLDIDETPGAGLVTLCRILVEQPRPVLLVTRNPEAARGALVRGLNIGAVDVLAVPDGASSMTPLQRDRILRIVATGASMRVSPVSLKEVMSVIDSMAEADSGTTCEVEDLRAVIAMERRFDIVGVAISTGGPNALGRFIPSLPACFPVPILVVQHIIPGFIDSIARRLNDSCEVTVKMAQQGEKLEIGTVYFAPDKKHLTMAKTPNGRLIAKLSAEPSNLLFCPSADVMFSSMAAGAGRRSLGVIMTGMGHDGVQGLELIKKAGGVTIAQDQDSSAIYGMARVAVDANIIDHVVPLGKMAQEIYRLLFDTSPDYSVKSSSSS